MNNKDFFSVIELLKHYLLVLYKIHISQRKDRIKRSLVMNRNNHSHEEEMKDGKDEVEVKQVHKNFFDIYPLFNYYKHHSCKLYPNANQQFYLADYLLHLK